MLPAWLAPTTAPTWINLHPGPGAPAVMPAPMWIDMHPAAYPHPVPVPVPVPVVAGAPAPAMAPPMTAQVAAPTSTMTSTWACAYPGAARELHAMGFFDAHLVEQALATSGGDVAGAVSFLQRVGARVELS